MEAERKRLADVELARVRAAELEKAKAESAERARIETEQRIARERQEEADRLAREVVEAQAEAARRAAMATDSEKFTDFADRLDDVETPNGFASDAAVDFWVAIDLRLDEIAAELRSFGKARQ